MKEVDNMRGKITSLFLSVLLLCGWTGMAKAKAQVAVYTEISTNLIKPGGVVTLQARASGIKGSLEYVFRERAANGSWQRIGHITKNRRLGVSLRRPGTYWLQSGVMTEQELRHKDYAAKMFSAPQVVYVGAPPS